MGQRLAQLLGALVPTPEVSLCWFSLGSLTPHTVQDMLVRWNGNSKLGVTNLFGYKSYFLGPGSYKGQPVCYNVRNFLSYMLFFPFAPLLLSEDSDHAEGVTET